MTSSFRQSDLDAFLDEALPPAEMARLERAVRDNPALARTLADVAARRDAGVLPVQRRPFEGRGMRGDI